VPHGGRDPRKDTDAVRLAVAASEIAGGAAVSGGLEIPREAVTVAPLDDPAQELYVVAADLVERDHAGVAGAAHGGGLTNGPTRVAGRDAAIAEVDLEHPQGCARPGGGCRPDQQDGQRDRGDGPVPEPPRTSLGAEHGEPSVRPAQSRGSPIP